MRIKLNLQIFPLIILFYFTHQIELYVMLMIFALLHEIAHMVIGIILGLKPKKLEIMALGFRIHFEKYIKKKSGVFERIIIALSGPLLNIILACAIYLIDFSIPETTRQNMVYANLLIAVFNLLPIYPLDGGRIIKALCKIKYDIKETIIIMDKISYISFVILTIISSFAILYYKNIAILIGILALCTIVLVQERKNKWRLRAYEVILADRNKK